MGKNGKPETRRKKDDKALQAIYARVRGEFSAADLQRFTVIEPTVPAAKVLKEMEAIYRQHAKRRKDVAARKKR